MDAPTSAQAAAYLLSRGWTLEDVNRLLLGPPSAPESPGGSVTPKAEPVKLSWTLASNIFADKPDPYNAAAINAAMREKRAGGNTDDINTFQRSLEVAMSTAMASTGYGAVVGVVFELLKLIVNYIVPLSSGGYDKLTVLQRQKANLYALLIAHEEYRNKRIYPSQKLDLSIVTPGAPDTSYGGTQTPPNRTDSTYRVWIRNRLIRLAYGAEFFRVCRVEDEPVLPTIMISLLQKNRLWPPPLPPIPISRVEFSRQFETSNPGKWFYYELASLDQDVLRREYDDLSTLYLEDASVFRKAIVDVEFPEDLRALAKTSGCVPEPFTPASPLADSQI